MTCRDAIAVLADYVDLALTPAERVQLEEHVVLCAACQAYLATYRATRRLIAAVGDVDLPNDARRRLRDRLRRALATPP